MTDTSKAHNAKVNGERGDMNLVKLIEQFADEDRCRTYLTRLRWPEGVRCPRCGFDTVKEIVSVSRYRRDTKDGHKAGEVREQRIYEYDCSSRLPVLGQVGDHLPRFAPSALEVVPSPST